MDESKTIVEETPSTMLSINAMQSPAYQNRMERETDDNSLVRRARNGDYGAFEILFERHREMVYHFSYRMVSTRDEAEDITQEAFVRAYQNLHRYRDEAKFTTWLLRIVTNLCTDQARMRTRRDSLEQQEATGALTWMTENTNEDPIQNLEQDRRTEILKKGLNALPAHHRQVIILRDLEEREYGEIAAVLGCTVGGAKLRVLRARRALKERIAPLLGEN
jgi:RNA polymerase sigma-70 factor (ECF subfamily)